jgi:hypothetical protein
MHQSSDVFFGSTKNLNTWFTLIHDVWTTKGNHFAFIGAAAAYVNEDWQYVVQHLTLKMIPWKHAGNLLACPIATLLKKNQLYQKISWFLQHAHCWSHTDTFTDQGLCFYTCWHRQLIWGQITTQWPVVCMIY